MFKSSVTLAEVVSFLNDLVALDPKAMYDLVETRVDCNNALADHPTVQVLTFDKKNYKVGILGVLNGLFGTDEKGYGAIYVTFEDEHLIKFHDLSDPLYVIEAS